MNNRYRYGLCFLMVGISLGMACNPGGEQHVQNQVGKLKIADNGRYLMMEDGKPFFWLGDTGWKLFLRLDRQEAAQYLEDRHQKGFNVIQVMVSFYNVSATNVYGDSIFVNGDVSRPRITEGNEYGEGDQYDYWDHMDYIIDLAAEKGIYMAIVPVWGTSVRAGWVTADQARRYAAFLANRYKNKENIIWLNGGDLAGSDSTAVWNAIGETLRSNDPNHLITFHPIGQTQSATWFHNASWLDFNMFQSGHLSYDQHAGGYGEDNWRYVSDVYDKEPVKPVLDGEAAYEGIPHGLNDTTQPRWEAKDMRRNAYWSVFAGGCGFTYGNNAVWQMYKPTDESVEYAPTQYWDEAMNADGAKQMAHIKKLMLSRPYFERIPDSSMVADQGVMYDYIAATRGNDYAFLYTFNGRDIAVNMGVIPGEEVKASWYNPRDGVTTDIGVFPNSGTVHFDPPGEKQVGNDWVLILDKL